MTKKQTKEFKEEPLTDKFLQHVESKAVFEKAPATARYSFEVTIFSTVDEFWESNPSDEEVFDALQDTIENVFDSHVKLTKVEKTYE